MRSTSTKSFRNIDIPRLLPVGVASGGVANSSVAEVRYDLLAAHGLQIPGRDIPRAAALYKFIDGAQFSPKDSLELSRWLDKAGLQNVKLLAAMQKLEPSFVPTLNLMRIGQSPQNLIDLIWDAQQSGMEFGVSVTESLPERVAIDLYQAMASPQCRVKSFDYPCMANSSHGSAPAIRKLLRDSIAACGTLECVSGFPTVLSLLALLECSVPEIRLTVLARPPATDELVRVLSRGGVRKLMLKSDLGAAHQWVADAVAEANVGLLPEHSVRHVELSTYSHHVDKDQREEIVARLFSCKHVTHLVLPHPCWVIINCPEGMQDQGEYYAGGWAQPLQSLQTLESLTFNARDGLDREGQDRAIANGTLDLLEAILQRNKQSALLGTEGAAHAFGHTMSMNLFGSIQDIDPLAKHLGKTFANTSTGAALRVVNVDAAARAKVERVKAEDEYEKSRDRAMLNYTTERFKSF